MAVRASKDGIVAGIGVAGGTQPSSSAMIGREPRMVERRTAPRRRRVTGLTGCREPRRRMIRNRRALVFTRMAGITVCGRAGVFAADVTTGARNLHMRSSQRKWRFAVIKGRARP